MEGSPGGNRGNKGANEKKASGKKGGGKGGGGKKGGNADDPGTILAKHFKAVAKHAIKNLKELLLELPSEVQGAIMRLQEKEATATEPKEPGLFGSTKKQMDEFLEFYRDIKKNMIENLQKYRPPDNDNNVVDVLVHVKADETLDNFSKHYMDQQRHAGDKSTEAQLKLASICQYVKNSIDASNGAQWLAFVNQLVCGSRWFEVHEYWSQHRGDAEMQRRGITSWLRFIRSLGSNFSERHVARRIAVFQVWKMYPNVGMISCCSMRQFDKYSRLFLMYLSNHVDEAECWIADAEGEPCFRPRKLRIVAGDLEPQAVGLHVSSGQYHNKEGFQRGRKRDTVEPTETLERIEMAEMKMTQAALQTQKEVEAVKKVTLRKSRAGGKGKEEEDDGGGDDDDENVEDEDDGEDIWADEDEVAQDGKENEDDEEYTEGGLQQMDVDEEEEVDVLGEDNDMQDLEKSFRKKL
jgi:hypothetical protein